MEFLSQPLHHSNYNNSSPTTLYVGGLSFFCREEDICLLLMSAGLRVISVFLKRKRPSFKTQHQQNILYGQVIVEPMIDSNGLTQDVDTAIRQLHCTIFMGRLFGISYDYNDVLEFNLRDSLVPVHFSFATRQKRLINEECLREIFIAYARLNVYDISLKRYYNSQHINEQAEPEQSGYGFVCVGSLEDKDRIISIFKKKNIQGITFDCSVSKSVTVNPRERGDENMLHLLSNWSQPLSSKPSLPAQFSTAQDSNFPQLFDLDAPFALSNPPMRSSPSNHYNNQNSQHHNQNFNYSHSSIPPPASSLPGYHNGHSASKYSSSPTASSSSSSSSYPPRASGLELLQHFAFVDPFQNHS